MKELWKFRENKFLYLFLSLIAFFILAPFFAQRTEELYVFGILFSIILVLSVYAIGHHPKLLWAAIVLALLAFFGHWLVALIRPGQEALFFDYAITIVFFWIITYVVIRQVILEPKVTPSTIFGAVCGYLLIAMSWSFLHALVFAVDPSAYKMSLAGLESGDTRLLTFIYYSFVTISTLGFGDITPVSQVAKMVSWLEAIAGQIYLTVWIAQLVGLHIANRHSRSDTTT